ncbi:MAG: hypothetical protein VX834_03265, partial [Myxococcota bacterium]|nr:hypothetical protein [Myxococcota bacterium]
MLSWFAVASFVCLGAIPKDAVAGDEVTTVYYYNPDSNLTDYAGLKRVADGFLGQLGAFQFQPFRDGAVFDMHTLVNSDGITI